MAVQGAYIHNFLFGLFYCIGLCVTSESPCHPLMDELNVVPWKVQCLCLKGKTLSFSGHLGTEVEQCSSCSI